MKKIIKNIFALGGLGILLGFSGCSESVEPKPLTYTQLLTGTTSKTWRLTSVMLIENGKEPEDYTSSCFQDDLYIFHANESKKFEFKSGQTPCYAQEPRYAIEDNWHFVNATATINFLFPPILLYFPVNIESLNFTVKRLTERSLTFEYYDKIDGYTIRFVMTAQGE